MASTYLQASFLKMRIKISCLLLLASLSSTAQDTLRVQTLTFDSITARRGWWQFPDATHEYRKALMVYTLKCDPATTWDQFNCGEWDYLTYSFVHEHPGTLDSAALQHPYFLVGAAAPDSVTTTTDLAYDSTFRWAPRRIMDSVWSETENPVGTGLDIDGTTFWTPNLPEGSRSQFLYTASELNAAGLQPGSPIERLRFNVASVGSFRGGVVRMKNTSATSISEFDDLGLITVYDQEEAPFNGTLDLASPFAWDGVNNVLVDLSFDHAIMTEVEATTLGLGQGVWQASGEGYVRTDNDFIGVEPNGFASLDDEVTIMFRTWGDPMLPINTAILEGVDAQGRRILNVHLPWSDGHIYWDAGNDGAGYDRIEKAATSAEYQGQWTTWAFTKNTATGSMKIYKNGALWHSGTGKTKPMSGITRFNIAADANRNNPYPGWLDDFMLFNVELDASTIQGLSGSWIDPGHPNWSDALYLFDFDRPAEFGVRMIDPAPGGDAWLMGTIKRISEPSTSLRRKSVPVSVRPDISFVQGTYTSSLDSLTAYTLAPHGHVTREIFQINGNSAVPTDTIAAYDTEPSISVAPDGGSDSTTTGGITYVNDTLDYFGPPYEVVNDWEIGRYITPYGIGLSLGPNGFSWVYDVTDYQHLLHDSVELSAGNTQELIDLRFDLIEGTPPREVFRLQRPWGPQRSYGYGGLSNDTQLPPTTVDLDPNAAQWVLRSRFTGHGDATSIPGVQGCCEFKDNTHTLSVNASPVDNWHVWQTDDCALNPVYPQGGTWIYAREGWCPGDVVKDHETDLTPYVSGTSAVIDYSITPVPLNNPGMAGGNYVANLDLFEYGAPTHDLDAEIYEVKRPTDAGPHSRENPICTDPMLVLRNAGAQELTSVTFTYQVSGGYLESFTWSGSLQHMESAEVLLPVPNSTFWSGDSAHVFTVTASSPNGSTDEYADNDSYTTHFELPIVYPGNFILFYRTNNHPSQNAATIRDNYGSVVYQKNWGLLSANTLFNDTLALDPGCYTLELTDSENDGLTFPWSDQGSGFFRFKNIGGGTLKNFETEFGHSIHWAFAISDIVGLAEVPPPGSFLVAPDPSDGAFTLMLNGVEGAQELRITDHLGREVHRSMIDADLRDRFDLDLSAEPRGIYVVTLTGGDRSLTQRIVLN